MFENQNDVWYSFKLVIWAHTKGMCFCCMEKQEQYKNEEFMVGN